MSFVYFLDVIILFPLMWAFYLLWRERKVFLSLVPFIIGIVFSIVARLCEVLTGLPTFYELVGGSFEKPSVDLVLNTVGNFADVFAILFFIVGFTKTIKSQYRKDRMITKLESLLPICAECKQYRAEDGVWHPIEQYLEESGAPKLTHGLCPVCAGKMLEEVKKLRAAQSIE
jgi:hypothetical protein